MSDTNKNVTVWPFREWSLHFLLLVAGGIWILWRVVFLKLLSDDFAYETKFLDRPVVGMYMQLADANAAYLLVCGLVLFAWRKLPPWASLGTIFAFAIAFRILLVVTHPILEIDLYRYIWDGKVALETHDPYTYSPREFVQGQWEEKYYTEFHRSEEEKEKLKEFYEKQTPGAQLVAQRIHFSEYTSPYPPVSQFFFAVCQIATEGLDESYSSGKPGGLKGIKQQPRDGLHFHVVSMKVMLTLFDLATGVVLVLILRQLGKPMIWSVAWLWSPLVLKEFANGGHLDSIAIFFCTLGVLFAVRHLCKTSHLSWVDCVLTGAFLACGFAAKVFPIFLMPLWFAAALRKNVFQAVAGGVVFCVLGALMFLPMYRNIQDFKHADKVHAKPGILAFADSWEMNDMMFMVAVENMKPSRLLPVEDEEEKPPVVQPVTPPPNKPGHWFSLTSEEFRHGVTDWFLKISPEPYEMAPYDQDPLYKGHIKPLQKKRRAAFRFTRTLSTGILGVLILGLCVSILLKPEEKRADALVRFAFIVLAWFWLMSPTQNPWYWCWALPFVMFTRSKSWLLIGGLALTYYLRFDFEYSNKVSEFDFVMPFFEFVPVLSLILIEGLSRFGLDMYQSGSSEEGAEVASAEQVESEVADGAVAS